MLTEIVFFCKSARALPYMSANQRSTSWWNRVRAFFINVPIKDTKGRVIDVKPWPKFVLDGGKMCFDKEELPEGHLDPEYPFLKADVVVYATGYSRTVPFFDQTYCQPNQAWVRDVHIIGDVTVGYIGFVRPGFGTSSRVRDGGR